MRDPNAFNIAAQKRRSTPRVRFVLIIILALVLLCGWSALGIIVQRNGW